MIHPSITTLNLSNNMIRGDTTSCAAISQLLQYNYVLQTFLLDGNGLDDVKYLKMFAQALSDNYAGAYIAVCLVVCDIWSNRFIVFMWVIQVSHARS